MPKSPRSLIYNNMGNIQIVEPTQPPRRPIFAHTPRVKQPPVSFSQDSFVKSRQSGTVKRQIQIQMQNNSPFYEGRLLELKTERLPRQRTHSIVNRLERDKRIDEGVGIDSGKQDGELSDRRELVKNNSSSVRNLNDFLNELNKKMKQSGYKLSSEQERCVVERPKEDMHKTIKLSLRLQNERLELDKYKRIVERELKKNHSIENIQLETISDCEKIFTIRYEPLSKLPPNPSLPSRVPQHPQANTGPQANTDHQFRQHHDDGSQAAGQTQYFQKLSLARQRYESLKQRAACIGELIQVYSGNIKVQETTHQFQGKTHRQGRVQTINSLFGRIEQICKIESESERKLQRLLLENAVGSPESESD